jgi:tryptophan synthase alpha subunit
MKLSQEIAAAQQQGRLGLLLYAVPHFPDPEAYAAIIEVLNATPELSILETTIPVRRGFSPHANPLIVEAHRQAAAFHGAPLPAVGAPQLCVLYRDTVEQEGFREVLQRFRYPGVLLEWDEPDPAPYAATATALGIELIQCVGPETPGVEVRAQLGLCPHGGLVYLMSASMTGAELHPPAELRRCAALVKHVRPDVKLAAGFGIRGPREIRWLKEIEGLDAVILGTAFLEAAARSRNAVLDFLGPVKEAL